MRFPFLLSIAIAVLVQAAGAQDLKNVAAPSAPALIPVADNMEWVITVKYPPLAKAAAPTPAPDALATPAAPDWRIAEVHTTKVGKLKKEAIKLMDGSVRETYTIDTIMLWTTPQGQVSVSDMNGREESGSDDDSPSTPVGFPGMKWVKVEFYKDAVLFDKKRPCHHYIKGGMEAWVDVETKVPVAYKSAEAIYQYKFNAPPTSLTLPPEFQKAYSELQRIMNARKRLQKDLAR